LIVPAQLAFFPQSPDAFLDAKILSLAGGTLPLFVTVPVTEPGLTPSQLKVVRRAWTADGTPRPNTRNVPDRSGRCA
jgi:hypothetical protein